MSGEIVTTSLAVELTDNALKSLADQRKQLKNFIKNQLEKDVDYGMIPGTKKDCLYKPGAEKLANIFKLGSRIIKNEKVIDVEKNYAMIAITIEIYSLLTNTAIATCEGICHSMESKYKSRPMVDMLNTLSKMAQKRGFVGAVIMATGASDFFTQDLEDMPEGTFEKDITPKHKDAAKQKPEKLEDFVVTFGTKYKGMRLGDMNPNEIESFANWLEDGAKKQNKPLNGQGKEFVEAATEYMHQQKSKAEATT